MPVDSPILSVLPPKRSRDHGELRRLVYLDQNAVTMIAKANIGRALPAELAAVVAELGGALKTTVTGSQTARCVESIFHREESSGLVILADGTRRTDAEDLFNEIGRFITYYSFGLWIAPGVEQIEVQAAEAVALDLGIEVPPRHLRWRAVLSRDPQERNEDGPAIRVGRSLMVIGAQWEPRTATVRPWAQHMTQARANGEFPSYESALSRIESDRRTWAIR